MANICASIETLDFSRCNPDTDKAKSIAAGLARFRNIESISWSFNSKIDAEGWTILMANISGSIETLDLTYCDLDTDKAKSIAAGLARFPNIKTINWSRNQGIDAEGWTILMASISESIETLDFADCNLDTDRAK